MVSITTESARTDDAEHLLRSAEAELRVRYPDYEPTVISPEAMEQVGAALFVARVESIAVGCVIVRPWTENQSGESRAAELNRLWVRPTARGRGIAKALLQDVEAWARKAGYQRIVLETGIEQPEAMALYGRCGYGRIACWGEYAGDEVSICYAKALALVDS